MPVRPLREDERVIIDPESSRITFRFEEGPAGEIHALLRREGGELVLEIEGGSRIMVMPRAANMIHVKLRDD
jgi:hypothetical protein